MRLRSLLTGRVVRYFDAVGHLDPLTVAAMIRLVHLAIPRMLCEYWY